MTTQGRRVIALAPMPPEKSAYALARYSRSPDSIEESIKWVHGHSSEKFWEQFYFDYGHGSIADLGHVIICFEQISELAAIRLERAGVRFPVPVPGSAAVGDRRARLPAESASVRRPGPAARAAGLAPGLVWFARPGA